MTELLIRIKKIKEISKSKNQKELAIIFGVNEGRIKSLESGKVDELKSKEILNLVEKLNLNPIWLISGKGNMILKECEKRIEQKGDKNVNISENHGTININNGNEMSHIICEEIKKLPLKRIEYFYHLVKLETLKEN
jgi:DNA-binding Xre family transcriptional regulator